MNDYQRFKYLPLLAELHENYLKIDSTCIDFLLTLVSSKISKMKNP